MKIFIDTAPFIYLIEDHPVFAAKVNQIITQAVVNNDSLVTSVIYITPSIGDLLAGSNVCCVWHFSFNLCRGFTDSFKFLHKLLTL